jgi:predicted porin
MKKLILLFVTAIGSVCVLQPAVADLNVYGKIHISGDYINGENSDDIALSSNSSRFGFKGTEKLDDNLKAVYKLETEIDATGETSTLGARNRYVGLVNNFGMVIVGYHDTPFKSIGAKSGVFADTIADRRAILGSGDGDNKFNTRGKNAVMYVSPKIAGLEVRVMQTTGSDSTSGLDENPILSTSALYKGQFGYFAVAYEDQSALESSGMRIGAGLNLSSTNINVIYEKLDSSILNAFDRPAYGVSVAHSVGAFTVKAQAFIAGDQTNVSDSGGNLYAAGVEQAIGKNLELYGLAVTVTNTDNAKFPLAGSGHGEKYVPVQGEAQSGVSAGIVYKF